MPFSWMDEASKERSTDGTKARSDAYEVELRERAGLLKRMGHDKATAIHRCLGNVAWAFTVQGVPPLSPAQIRKIVNGVYGSRK